jgi:hypothetical protein
MLYIESKIRVAGLPVDADHNIHQKHLKKYV